MDDRDIYEISFDFTQAGGDLEGLVKKLEDYEQKITAILTRLETAVVGSANGAVAQLTRLDKAIGDSLDNIQKKTAGRKKPIVIVEKKDVDEAKKNLDAVGDAVTELKTVVDDAATEIQGDIKRAFEPPPTVVTDTQIFPGTPSTKENMNAAVFGSGYQTQVYPPVTPEPEAPKPSAPSVSPEDQKALAQQAKEAAAAERALIRLYAAELKVAAGADTITKAYIDSAAATAKNSAAFLDQVEMIAKVEQSAGHLSKAQVQYAIDVANTKNEINKLNRALQEQVGAYDAAATAAKNAENDLAELNPADGGDDKDGKYKAAQENAKRTADALQVEVAKRDRILAQLDAMVQKQRDADAANEARAASFQAEAADMQKVLDNDKKAQAQRDAAAKAAEAAQAKLNRQREQAAAQFNRIARSMGVESTALNVLAQKYGVFEATIRKSGVATNALEKEIQDIIKQSPQLQQVVAQLTDGIEEFTIKADPSTFKIGGSGVLDPNEIRQLGFAFQRFGVTGVAAFGEIYAAIGPAGIAVGVVTLGIVGLAKALVAMGRAGVEAFKKVVAASVELASKRETLAAGFEAYLGNAEAAAAALQEVDRISGQLGIDISPIAQSFLPQINSIKDLELLAEVAQSLALSKPGKTIEDTTVALRELGAGDVTSLRKQFEIPSYVLDQAKDAIDSTGELAAGALVLKDYLDQAGRSVEALGDTYAVSLTRGQEFLNTLGRDAGAPIVQALEDSLNEAFDLVTEKEDLLRGFAYGFGTIIADVLGSISNLISKLVDSLNEEQFSGALTTLYSLGSAVKAFIDAISGGAGLVGPILEQLLARVERFFLMGAATINMVGAMIDSLQTLAYVIQYALNPALFLAGDGMAKLEENVEQFGDRMAEITRLNEQYIDASNRMFGQDTTGTPGAEEFFAGIQAYIDSLKNTDASGLDDILASKRQDALTELTDAIDKYLEELRDLQQDVRNKNLDLAVKLSDNILDFLDDVAQKRKELALKNRDDLIDLEDEYERKIRDANQDMADDLEDIGIEEGRNRLKQAREFADKRLEIEEDYQRKIAEIRRKYAFDLEEAARQNDAVAYLRLLRKREFDLNEARIDRDESLGDVDTDEAKKTDEAARKRREDEEDARRSYKRKMRDLLQWLDDEQEEIKKNYKRELEAQARQEEEKYKEIFKNYQRDLRDLHRHYDQRLEELQKKYAEEYDLVALWEQKIVDMQTQIRSTFGFGGKNRPGGAGGRLGDEPVQPGGLGGTVPTGGSGGSGGAGQTHSRQWYEDGIVSVARRLGYNDYIINGIQRQFANMSMTQLVAMYNRLASLYANQTNAQVDGTGTGSGLSATQSQPTTLSGVQAQPSTYRQPAPAAAYSYNNSQRNVKLDMSVLDTSLLKREMIEMIKMQLAQALEEAF